MTEKNQSARPLSDYPEILTARNVAEYLNVGYCRALEILKNGSLPSIKIGSTYRVSRTKLEDWLNKPEKQAILSIVK